MVSTEEFSVRFYGVRGSIACPGPDTVKYGGNTPCVEVRCGGRVLMFDAGTGARALGQRLVADGDTDVDLFLSHTHIDHIIGFPFFCFAARRENTLRVWAGHLKPDSSIESVMRTFMCTPLFPVPVDFLEAAIEFKDFSAGETLVLDETTTIRTTPLNHPGRATGYRVEHDGKAICYITDTEHRPGNPDRNIRDLIAGADIVIYDAMYSDEELKTYQGWGHSTWQECLRLCRDAGVKVPVIFHHLPGRDDKSLDDLAVRVAREYPGALIAREGVTLTP